MPTVTQRRLRLPLADTRALDLLSAWGVPYSWGAGFPKSVQSTWPDGARGLAGGVGWDCSGFAQAALVRLGLLSPAAPDRTAGGLYDLMVPVVPNQERLGDCAFYGIGRVSHVMVVLGTDLVLGASGGGSATNGDDPRAYVKLERIMYRNDFVGIRRIRPDIEAA
jgi:cell wall-associated NlpC family hydrolase